MSRRLGSIRTALVLSCRTRVSEPRKYPGICLQALSRDERREHTSTSTRPVRPGQLRLVISRAKGRNRVTVSVFVIVRCAVADLGKALEWGKANGDIAEDITAYGKSLGQIGHRMLTDGKDLVVIDEWPDADTFNKFFAGAAKMGEFLSGAGVVGEPEVTILNAVDVAGQFLSFLRQERYPSPAPPGRLHNRKRMRLPQSVPGVSSPAAAGRTWPKCRGAAP